MMGQLASALAHEINQPLGAILRNAEAAELFMQDASPDMEEIRAIVADIRKDDQRAGAVIDRMRSLLKRQPLDTRTLDVGELIRDVRVLVKADAAARQVKLEVGVPGDLPPVRGDRVHLQQVLLNVILNGMDALSGASGTESRISVIASRNGSQTVEIAVSDTGSGIPADKLVHIFDPFFTTKPNGMGMGLPISRTIIEAHGGRFWAENNASGGATFRFTLPIAEEVAGKRA
jgi:C4-dicarboxylate-specific signal transduction histidine kinase